MLTEICQEIKNWFEYKKLNGNYTIENGSLTIPQAQDGQYIRIVGSVFNDGVHQYPCTELHDETFNGSIWLLAIPSLLVDISNNIDQWVSDNNAVLTSPYQSESFGGYSYTKASNNGGQSSNGGLTWQNIFGSQLNKWRKI